MKINRNWDGECQKKITDEKKGFKEYCQRVGYVNDNNKNKN